MAGIANLPRGLGVGTRKLAFGSGSVTGTGTIATGLTVVENAVVQPMDSANTIPTNLGAGHSVGTSLAVVIVAAAAAANTVSAVAATVHFFAVGH